MRGMALEKAERRQQATVQFGLGLPGIRSLPLRSSKCTFSTRSVSQQKNKAQEKQSTKGTVIRNIMKACPRLCLLSHTACSFCPALGLCVHLFRASWNRTRLRLGSTPPMHTLPGPMCTACTSLPLYTGFQVPLGRQRRRFLLVCFCFWS